MSRRKKDETPVSYADPLTDADPAVAPILEQLQHIHDRYTLLLPQQQMSVLDCYLSGMSYANIARECRISVDAVRTALRDIATYFACDIADIRAACKIRGYVTGQ